MFTQMTIAQKVNLCGNMITPDFYLVENSEEALHVSFELLCLFRGKEIDNALKGVGNSVPQKIETIAIYCRIIDSYA